VVLALLGRTDAPEPPVLPAALVAVAAGSALPPDFAHAVGRAFLARDSGGDELYVPLEEAQALELLRHDPVRIKSTLATMDGRWWQAEKLHGGGAENAIVYRPGGRLRIDFTSDHARLVLPWPAAEGSWAGDVRLPDRFELFGREWRGRAWERDARRAWLHLEFTRALAAPDALEGACSRRLRLRPASSEMAWSELERALATGFAHKDAAAIDALRREDLIPLARALERLAGCVVRRSSREDLERALRSIRYHHGSVAEVYGLIPWRVLPARVRDGLRKARLDAGAAGLIHEVFEDASGVAAPHRAA
jgi:hypothetical protein